VHAKARLVQLLTQCGHEVSDEGTNDSQSVDYPDFASIVSSKVSQGQCDRGILICGTGIGMCITANKFPGVRAACCHDEVTAELSRRHNDTNVLCLSGDALSDSLMDRVVKLWMETPFEGGRHLRTLACPPRRRRRRRCVVPYAVRTTCFPRRSQRCRRCWKW
jgi:ribose 5-phosphate isomerase B